MPSTEKKEISAIIYVINLDIAIERKKSIQEELLKTTIPHQFVTAIDKKTSETVKHKVINKYKRSINLAEIACFLSHVKVKELFLESQYDFAIILEDDVDLSQDFDELVKKAIKQHSSLPKKHQWDVLKLASFGRKKMLKIKDIDKSYSIYGGSVGISTMGAIWTKRGAKSFLQKIIQDDYRTINMPIDCTLQTPSRYGLKLFNIAPSLVKPKDFDSHIRPERLKSDFLKRLNYERRRILPRVLNYFQVWMIK